MNLQEAVRQVNEASNSELGFLRDRTKGDVRNLIGREIIFEDVAVVTSKFYNNENVLFTVRGDNVHYFRLCSGPVVEAVKKLMEGLANDGKDWDAVAVTISEVRSRQGRRYYMLTARILEDADEQIAL
ncbi:hypothetical protein MTAT_16930 [Moorella thermoacetica]|uniref:Uncharacterized protein n=1 Tax=Neomoorella thermoacetica TaxID=1525 RepID=A0AAC9HGC3_NEOTH|nr:hypothetical protein [Moorella thermoacetica]AOQ23163.1 hypothetical protein Maut_00700 [Moorella thermoacetica]TYL12870.1 hypothetical protein MTAT_16930 [Moorella thermoacetica]